MPVGLHHASAQSSADRPAWPHDVGPAPPGSALRFRTRLVACFCGREIYCRPELISAPKASAVSFSKEHLIMAPCDYAAPSVGPTLIHQEVQAQALCWHTARIRLTRSHTLPHCHDALDSTDRRTFLCSLECELSQVHESGSWDHAEAGAEVLAHAGALQREPGLRLQIMQPPMGRRGSGARCPPLGSQPPHYDVFRAQHTSPVKPSELRAPDQKTATAEPTISCGMQGHEPTATPGHIVSCTCFPSAADPQNHS